MTVSTHYKNDRNTRSQIIKQIGSAPILSINGVLCVFKVDKGHRDGAEIHVITENAIINIYNQNSHKFVTSLIARPAQLLRYGVNIPENVLEKARDHMKKGYNEI